MMQSQRIHDKMALTLSREEALVLSDLLQRLVDDESTSIIPLLRSSAEMAVLCRIGNHLEKNLPEVFSTRYDELLQAARANIIKETGRYPGVEEL